MFCPNCNADLTEQNQSFCSKCGSEIEAHLETPQLRTERPRQVSTNTLQLPPESTSVPIYQPNSVKKEKGESNPYSTKCLNFAILSIVFTIIGAVINIGGIIFSMISRFGNAQIDFGFLPRMMIISVLSIIGLIFGITSRVIGKKAGELEPINAVEKFGSVLAIFGIIINAIALVVILILGSIWIL